MSEIDEHATLETMRYELRQWILGANITAGQRARLTDIANGVVRGNALHREPDACTCGVGCFPPRPHDHSCPLASTNHQESGK